MDTNRENDDTVKAPALTWNRKKEWGSDGMTHRAEATAGHDKWHFVVDHPSSGGPWQARGWCNEDFAMYAEGRTMRDAKDICERRMRAEGWQA